MQRVLGGHRYLGLALTALLLTAAAGASVAEFAAPSQGADLEPIGSAEALIELIQTNETVLWKTLEGSVSSYSVLGWPSSDAVHDLGGSLVVERPANDSAGIIETAEKPMRLTFSIEN